VSTTTNVHRLAAVNPRHHRAVESPTAAPWNQPAPPPWSCRTTVHAAEAATWPPANPLP